MRRAIHRSSLRSFHVHFPDDGHTHDGDGCDSGGGVVEVRSFEEHVDVLKFVCNVVGHVVCVLVEHLFDSSQLFVAFVFHGSLFFFGYFFNGVIDGVGRRCNDNFNYYFLDHIFLGGSPNHRQRF